MKQSEIIERLRGGDRVMITHPDPEKVSDTRRYGLVKAGVNIGVRNFRAIFDDLRPCADGLFGTDGSQTFEWNPER